MSEGTRRRYTPGSIPRPWWWIASCCAVLVLYHVWHLPGAWSAWRAGLPDLYPSQHRRLFLGHVTGLALALGIPLNGVVAAAGDWPRQQRVALWGASGVLMAIALAALVGDVAR